MVTPEERSRILNSGTDEITRAFQEAVRRALERHHHAGVPIEIWKDGRIVTIPAEDIPALLAAQGSQRESDSAPSPATAPTP